MRATKVIAWLLLTYWLVVGLTDLIFVQGLGLDGSVEFLIYGSIGVCCYLVTTKIGGLLARYRTSKSNREFSKWR